MAINVGVFPGDSDPQSNAIPVPHDTPGVYYEVEVYRQETTPVNVIGLAREVELVRPVGTMVNVGHGPSLPTNPYEGQVWILT